MTRSLLIATQNKKKLAEMADILSDLPLKMLSPADFGDIPPPEETGDTFEENACEKALAYARATGVWAVADDSGLEVACLGGRPGVMSSRWGGRPGDDARNREKLLAEVARYRPEEWQARYVCVAALASPEKILITTRGTCEGIITASGRGTWGFGYDPNFFVPSFGKTMAEIPPEVKNRISHRARALRAFKEKLKGLI